MENSITGERVTFLDTSEETNGERVVGPPGVLHAWRNPSEDEELRIVSELRPALHLEALIKASFGLAKDLKTDKKNALMRLPRMMLLVNEAKHEFYLTGVPRSVRRAFSVLLGAFAYVIRRLGYAARIRAGARADP